MIEIRFHGRGGQGAVVASRVLAEAFFQEGKYVQSFPAFGAERRGAPVGAFCRADDVPIRIKTHIYEPDHVVVLDASLPDAVDVTAGLKEGGWIIINTDSQPDEPERFNKFRIAIVDAGSIAAKHGLGSATAPIVNTAILGAFARATQTVGADSLQRAVQAVVTRKTEENAAACREAYEQTRL